MKNILLFLTIIVGLSGCSQLGKAALGAVTGGGPKVNAQVGATNSQTVGQTKNVSQKTTVQKAETFTQVAEDKSITGEKVRVTNVDPWVLGLLMLFAGFVIPSPKEIVRGTMELFRRKN